MNFRIDVVADERAKEDFASFHDQVYSGRAIRRVDEDLVAQLLLGGTGPFADGRSARAVMARRDDGAILTRAAGVVDRHHQDRWADDVGHVVCFESLPGEAEAARAVLEDLCGWLRSQGMAAARAGHGGLPTESPFALDGYDTLPPQMCRQSPIGYHRLLKSAGFVTERGWLDYRAGTHEGNLERWRRQCDPVRLGDLSLVRFGEVPADMRVGDFRTAWNLAFHDHWGSAPLTHDELDLMTSYLGPLGMDEFSVLAYRHGEPVGAVWVLPFDGGDVRTTPGRGVSGAEAVNFLAIGVVQSERGRGTSLAMAAQSYLRLAESGATHVGYTLVLDDNWPSRRLAEKLGAQVADSYVTYRCEL